MILYRIGYQGVVHASEGFVEVIYSWVLKRSGLGRGRSPVLPRSSGLGEPGHMRTRHQVAHFSQSRQYGGGGRLL